MSQEPTTPDLVALTQQAFDAGNRHDIDAIMGFHVPDAVWDLSDLGLGTGLAERVGGLPRGGG